MRKTLLMTLFALVFCLNGRGQSCLPNGITFSTQASIDNFSTNYPGCTQIGGYVYITGADITNLNGLSVLTSVYDLVIDNNPALTSLSGLGNLVYTSSLGVNNNATLTSLAGLGNITSMLSYLDINNNATLTSLAGLEHITSIQWMNVGGNASLISLSGLNSSISVGNLMISGNPLLSSLAGLENITDIKDINISGNASLTSLNGLNSLTKLDSVSYILGNPLLKNLNGLENITWISQLNIYGNASLTSLNGLENLAWAYGLIIDNNTSLTSLAGLEKLATASVLSIDNNASLTSLNGLESLQTVSRFYIEYDSLLTSLAGLENLKQADELYITHNPLLTNIDALKQLERIGHDEYGNFYIEENTSLTNLSGLENLTVLGGDLRVVNNPDLSDCAVYAVCNHILNEPTLVTISGNASGCDSPAAVALQCHNIPVVAEVRLDNNGNCQSDQTDPLAADVQVWLEGGGQMLLKATNQQGSTRFGYLENGPFDLFLPQFPAGNWAVCQEPLTFNPNGSTDTIRATLLLSPLIQCPELTVHLGLPSFFRGCLRTSDLLVSTENTGTVTAQGVKIAVVIPPVLELLASLPLLAGQQGDTLFFDLGNLAPFGKSNVILTVRTKCDTFLVDQSLCIETFATLDNACPKNLPAFSEIKASAKCIGGNLVRLSLENIGDAPTQGYHAYKIIRNDLIMNDNPFNLAAHESLSFDFNADGATWRLEATKFDDGTETAASVENCGGLTPGWITGFWQDHGPLEYDFDCRQVSGSYDPNLKTVVPSAYLIRPNKPLQYTIDFQNIGNDTAFRVLLLDVLPTSLDLNTFRPGYASHPYSWEIHGKTLEVLFSPISLPGSGMNEPASHGFFSFEIDQKPDLPEWTYIENTATIVFDYNPPIYTNYVGQQIGRLTVQVDEAPVNASAWQVLGNPTSNTAVFRATEFIPGDKQFELYDVSGKRVRSAVFSGQIFEFQRDMLGSGMYFFRIADARGRVNAGKILIAD